MPESLRTNYQSLSEMDRTSGSRKKFFVFVRGETEGAHVAYVKKLKGVGQTEVGSPGDSDYLVVFCPITSRAGTNISEALEGVPADKPILLVVMHHTFNPDHLVPGPWADIPQAFLTNCLFYRGELLKCDRNDTAWLEIQRFVGVPPREMDWTSGSRKKFFVFVRGETEGAHVAYVKKLKGVGQTEVGSPGDSDYLVVFCPITSRAGTNISEALEGVPADKPILLVVMHHTFNPDHLVPGPWADIPQASLTNCLFYRGELLKCDRNDTAWLEIQRFVGVPPRSLLGGIISGGRNVSVSVIRNYSSRLYLNFTHMVLRTLNVPALLEE